MKGKTVIVTGGAKGIGRAVALAFADEGADIVLNYRSTSPDAVKAEIEARGVKCLAVQADVSAFAEADKLVSEAMNEFGRVDVLVNNAGITRDTLLMRMKEEDFDAVINTNLKGCFNMMRAVTKPMMKQRKGAIINMSSVIGLAGNIGQVNYAASKAGILGMTYSAAKELASRNITCNAVAPGMIATDMTAVLSDKMKEQILQNIPLGRLGQPEEIAQTVLFLAKSEYITGQVITVDGGMVIGR